MNNSTVCMANGEPLSEEILGISADDLKLYERTETIKDMEFKTESVSYGKDVLRNFVHSKVTMVAAVIVVFIVVMAIIGPYLNSYTYLEQHTEYQYMPPRIPILENLGIFDGSKTITVQVANLENYADYIIKDYGSSEETSAFGTIEMEKIKIDYYAYMGADDVYYWFGSDALGRDLFTRLWQGTRVSLILAFSVVLINLSIGLVVGAICGYYGGWVDMIIQRLMDIVWNIPSLPLTILLIMLFGSGILPLMLVFCLTGWMGTANSVRMQFYRFKNKEYVLSARTMGVSDVRIMARHILPNAVGTIITGCALAIPGVVFQEAGLSYLGLGVQAPNPSIGMLLYDGQQALLTYPYMIVAPGILIVLLMLAFNLLGNGLRDAFNPTLMK